jgi:hypothetical protein
MNALLPTNGKTPAASESEPWDGSVPATRADLDAAAGILMQAVRAEIDEALDETVCAVRDAIHELIAKALADFKANLATTVGSMIGERMLIAEQKLHPRIESLDRRVGVKFLEFEQLFTDRAEQLTGQVKSLLGAFAANLPAPVVNVPADAIHVEHHVHAEQPAVTVNVPPQQIQVETILKQEDRERWIDYDELSRPRLVRDTKARSILDAAAGT